jgi:hypothetical protein
VFFLRSGGTADHRLLHNVWSASDVRIDRIAKLPATCDHPTPNTPLGNFEVFNRTWPRTTSSSISRRRHVINYNLMSEVHCMNFNSN